MKPPQPKEHRFSLFAAPLLLAALATSSCMSDPYGGFGYGGYGAATPAQRGAITGAIAGGVIGGIAREDIGGVALGAAIGAIAGAATGQAIDNNRRRQQAPRGYRNDNRNPQPPATTYPRLPRTPYPARDDERAFRPAPPKPPAPAPAPSPAPPPQKQHYPSARKTSDPNRVISPYPPNNMIDVEGFHTGDLAIDPTTEKIFRIP